MPDPLAHLTVVELCDELPGAYCARQFAAWGATVLRVEPPDGSPLRRVPPLATGNDGEPRSLVWEYVNANKQIATLDPQDLAACEQLRALIARADVLVTDWAAERLAANGLVLSEDEAPQLITVRVSPFGEDGPYAGFASSDLVIQALSGMLSLSGYPDRAPLKLPANLLPYACGVSAFIGAMAALHERRASGRSQTVELAYIEAVASLVLFLRAQYLGEPFPRRSGVATAMLPCANGYVLCSPGAEQVWGALLTALGIEPEQVPDGMATQAERVRDLARVIELLSQHTRGTSAKQLFTLLGTLGVVAGLYETPAQLLSDEHLAARSFWQDFEHATLGQLRFPGPAGHMSETPMAAPQAARPSSPGSLSIWSGWSTEDAARRDGEGELPYGRDAGTEAPLSPVAAARRTGERDRGIEGPLTGLRVLDLTGAWIGPYAAMTLADLGAEVIKVEAPQRPDVWRIYRPTPGRRPELPPGANPRAHPRNTSFYFNSVNRNKRGLALDFNTREGRELFLQLVSGADVVMENFTPRVLDNFGLDYEALRRARPDLIMASFSGYGASGPYRDFKANGATIETIAGWTALFGYPGEPPMSMGEMEADPLSGLQMAAHTLVALEHRARTGQGQRIDGSMFEAAAGYVGEEILLAQTGSQPHPRGNRDRAMAPQGAFPCAGSDSWIAITVRDDRDWQALLGVAAEAPHLHDPRFATVADRLALVDEVEAAVADWTATHDAHELMSRLQAARVPAGVVLKTDEAPNDPHFRERGWFRPLEHPDMGTHLYNGYPWRFSRSGLAWGVPPPRIGEHSAAVLAERLGLDADEYERLAARGVTGATLEWPEEVEAGR